MKVVAVYVVLCLTVVVACTQKNPGFRAIITTKGMNYAHDIGLSLLKEWLCNYTIPTTNITGQVGLANVTYNFSNVEIHSLSFGQSSLTSDTRGFVLSIRGFSMSFSANFLVNETDWPYYTDRGSGEVSVRGLSLTISVDLLVNRTGSGDGRFAANVTSCSFSIDKIDLMFKGGASFVYNLFGPALAEYLKQVLNKGACLQLTNWTNEYANMYLGPLPTTIVFSGIEIDYGLVSDADFSRKGRVVTNHKGEILVQSDPTDPPFTPPPLPDPSEEKFPGSKMVYLVISKYVAESASYAFWKAGRMTYILSTKDLPTFLQKTKFWCSVLSAPMLCKKFPNRDVKLGIAVVHYPTLNVTSQYASLHAKINLTMYVTNSSGGDEMAFVLQFDAEGDVDPYFNVTNNHICGNVSSGRVFDLHTVKTNIGNLNTKGLESVINESIPAGVDYVNEHYTQPGVPIPSFDGIVFTNTTLKLGEGYVVIGSDVSYTPEFLPSNATC